ncbi:hypothetical protein [Photobacterium leiognathi]|uniref:hypothetical protein n=1 Tax=Photobacterium leiognathi TaxID=553611 RepID=UPI002982463D|nr:hypothetical protein [Photobacterium leiognathi]
MTSTNLDHALLDNCYLQVDQQGFYQDVAKLANSTISTASNTALAKQLLLLEEDTANWLSSVSKCRDIVNDENRKKLICTNIVIRQQYKCLRQTLEQQQARTHAVLKYALLGASLSLPACGYLIHPAPITGGLVIGASLLMMELSRKTTNWIKHRPANELALHIDYAEKHLAFLETLVANGFKPMIGKLERSKISLYSKFNIFAAAQYKHQTDQYRVIGTGKISHCVASFFIVEQNQKGTSYDYSNTYRQGFIIRLDTSRFTTSLGLKLHVIATHNADFVNCLRFYGNHYSNSVALYPLEFDNSFIFNNDALSNDQAKSMIKRLLTLQSINKYNLSIELDGDNLLITSEQPLFSRHQRDNLELMRDIAKIIHIYSYAPLHIVRNELA